MTTQMGKCLVRLTKKIREERGPQHLSYRNKIDHKEYPDQPYENKSDNLDE